MSEINRYLRVIDENNKAGENLEYDDMYSKMETLATNSIASLASADEDGKTEADYKSLLKVTSSLLEKTRDLRVATFHTIALTATQGFKGLNDGLLLLGFISVELWDEAYPQLDIDDELDPTERLNIFSTLSPTSVNDPFNFIGLLGKQPLCPPLPITSRDIKIAKGIINSDDSDADIVLLKGQILSLPDAAYTENYKLILKCIQATESFERVINSKITSGYLNLEKLKNELNFILRFLDESRGAPDLNEQDFTPESQEAPQDYQEVQTLTPPQTPNIVQSKSSTPSPVAYTQGTDSLGQVSNNVETVPVNAYIQLQAQVQHLQQQLQEQIEASAKTSIADLTIESRKDALTLIEKCREYFQRKEPTSPVPFLLQRALNMADMNFIQLLGEIDSSALERGREQLGVKAPPEDY